MKRIVWCAVAAALAAAPCGAQDAAAPEAVMLTRVGRGCFLFEDNRGITLATDLYDPHGEPLPGAPLRPDIIIFSHAPMGYAETKMLVDSPHQIIRTRGYSRARKIAFNGLRVTEGTIAYQWEMGGISFLFLGDCAGADITDAMRARLAGSAVVFFPVDGDEPDRFIDAWALIESLSPRLVVPMRYDTDGMAESADTYLPFLAASAAGRLDAHGSTVVLRADELPAEMAVLIFDLAIDAAPAPDVPAGAVE